MANITAIPELLDAIIDQLHDEETSLLSCSLVAKSWLPRARFHLFGTIRIRHSGLDQFLDTLNHPLSTLPTSIHYLVLLDFMSPANREHLLARVVDGAFSSLRIVSKLEIQQTTFHSISEYVGILSALRRCRLECLKLHNVWWPRYSSGLVPLNPASTIIPHLRSLSLGNCDKASLMTWLLEDEPNNIAPLSILSMHDMSWQEIATIGKFLRTLQHHASLEHVVIDIESLGRDGDRTSPGTFASSQISIGQTEY